MNKHLYQSNYKKLPAILFLFIIFTAVVPERARAQNSSASKTDNQDLFSERFREGRDLIDRQNWAQAMGKFREALEKSPDHKLADAALYWLAFCYKKQKKYAEADAALDRLLEKFPASAWTSDAKVMKLEIEPLVGRLGVSGNTNININIPQGQSSADLQEKIVKGTSSGEGQNPTLAEKLAMSQRLPLDRTDEIKLAAFQSLLNADPKRAVETMGEVLTPDSVASETLKREILRVWRNPRLFASNAFASIINKNAGGGKEFVALLRETLVKGFQNERNLKIRIEIIYTLASFADAQSLEYLKRLYATETDRDIRKDIINSFGISTESSKFNSGSLLGEETGFDISREQKRKMQIEILLEIVRGEKDLELRRLAFVNLRRFQSWASSARAVETMTRLYDAESDEEFKVSLIRAFAESKQTSATKKLLDIARREKSDKLKLEAIYALRTSKDPEVLRFLEDLIK